MAATTHITADPSVQGTLGTVRGPWGKGIEFSWLCIPNIWPAISCRINTLALQHLSSVFMRYGIALFKCRQCEALVLQLLPICVMSLYFIPHATDNTLAVLAHPLAWCDLNDRAGLAGNRALHHHRPPLHIHHQDLQHARSPFMCSPIPRHYARTDPNNARCSAEQTAGIPWARVHPGLEQFCSDQVRAHWIT